MFGGAVVRSLGASFKPQVPKGQRVYAIGDIHGCAELLNELHDQIESDIARRGPADISVVYLGDYVDRGPDSRGVLEALVTAKQKAASKSRSDTRFFLKGNHEALFLAFMEDPGTGPGWLRVGGLETLASYGIDAASALRNGGYSELAKTLAKAIPASHLELLRELKLSATAGDYFFCHAGVRPGVALERQDEDDLIWIRDAFTASRVKFGKVVVHGHTPVRTPKVYSNRIAIDTEAYKSGRLSCLVLEGADQRLLST